MPGKLKPRLRGAVQGKQGHDADVLVTALAQGVGAVITENVEHFHRWERFLTVLILAIE